MQLHDYNGTGRWSPGSILERYAVYARDLAITQTTNLAPYTNRKGDSEWTFPVMDEVIPGIKRGDKACIAIGIEFIEEDRWFPLGP
jgi:hypothetical protein